MTRRRLLVAECGQKHDASNGKPVAHDCYTFDVGSLAAHARRERLRQDPYCTTFCNHPHDLRDGKPIGHECYILIVDVLVEESDGIIVNGRSAIAEPRKIHRGKKTHEPAMAKGTS